MAKNKSSFAAVVAPTLTAYKPAPTAVVAPATIGNMTQDDLVAIIARTVAATLAAKKPATAKKPALVPVASKPAAKPAPADGQSKSAAYIARCGNVDPKVVKGHLANAYRAGQAAQAGDRTAIGSGRYKAAYNATLISAGLPPFYTA